MRLFWRIYFRFKEWNYKRKYGFTMGEAMKEYGRHIILTEPKDIVERQD